MKTRVVLDFDRFAPLRELKNGETSLTGVRHSELRNNLEALEDFARADLGPWPVRTLWIHDLTDGGFIVRGDSPIKEPKDIKPGTRFATWNGPSSPLKENRGLIAWAGLKESDIVWVDAGRSYDIKRLISDGEVDIAFIRGPDSVTVFELYASLKGIQWVNLDPSKDPQGAKRFQQVDPFYALSPIHSTRKEALGIWGTTDYGAQVVNEKLGVDFAYNLVKWLDENYSRYKDLYPSNQFMNLDNLMEMLATTHIPVHDGLIKYLKEKGKWTPAHDARQKVNLDLLNKYIDAYPKAVALAAHKGEKVDPANREWQKLWTQYKIDNKIPKFVMHSSLKENGPLIFGAED